MVAGLVQSSQQAVEPQSLANRLRLLMTEQNSPAHGSKYDTLAKLYVKSGATIEADGTRVCQCAAFAMQCSLRSAGMRVHF